MSTEDFLEGLSKNTLVKIYDAIGSDMVDISHAHITSLDDYDQYSEYWDTMNSFRSTIAQLYSLRLWARQAFD